MRNLSKTNSFSRYYKGMCVMSIRRGWNRQLLYLLILVLFVSSCDAAVISSLPKASLNTTAGTFSPCTRPPDECPNSDKDVSLHIACFYNYRRMSCPEGYKYFCDPNSSGYLVENCFLQNRCPIGTNYVDFSIHNLTAKLACRPCQGNFTQPVPHDSAIYSSPGCIEPQLSIEMIQNLPEMILVKDANITGYPQYVCDSSRGYSNIHGNMICNVSTLCECDDKVKCRNQSFPILLPDGSCDKPCMKDREMMFKCEKYQEQQIIEPSIQRTTTTVHPVINITSDNAQNNAQVTTDALTSDETNSNLWWIIPLVVIAIVVIKVTVVVCWGKKHSKSNEVSKGKNPEEKNLLKQNTDRNQPASQSDAGNQIAHPTDSDGGQASVGTSSFSEQYEKPELKSGYTPAEDTGSLTSSESDSVCKDSSFHNCSFSSYRRGQDSESDNLFSQDTKSHEQSELKAFSDDCYKAQNGGPNPDIRNDYSQMNGRHFSGIETDQSTQKDDQASTYQSLLHSVQASVIGSDRSVPNGGQASVMGCDCSPVNDGQASGIGNFSTRQNNFPASGSGNNHSQQNGYPVSCKVKDHIKNLGGNESLNIQDGQATFNGPVKVSGKETFDYKIENNYGTVNNTYILPPNHLPPNQSEGATGNGAIQMKDLGTDYDVNKTDLKETKEL